MSAAGPADDILHVFHTNDFHHRLTEPGSETLRAALQNIGDLPFLLLDAGDAIKAGNLGVSLLGEPTLERMSEIGYHAMTLGNREFHVLESALRKKVSNARFPILSANLRRRDRASDAPLPVRPFANFTRGGRRITVIGVTVPMVTARMKVAPLSNFLFDDPVETAATLAAEQREHCDLLLALTHIGIKPDERLAARTGDFDAIIGGHTHVVLEQPKIVENTPVLQAGSHGRFYGHAIFRFGNSGDRPCLEHYRLHALETKKS